VHEGKAWVGASLLLIACSASTAQPRAESRVSVAPDVGPPQGSAQPEPEPEPPLTRDEIRLVVRAKLAEVRDCFDTGLASDPTLGGRVALRFTIDAAGRVRDSTIVEDQLASSSVAACLLERIEHWQFPRPRAGQELTIVYPFHFTAEDTLRAAGLPRVEGTLRPAAVGQVFEANRRELDECLALASVTSGAIGVAFTIDDAGVVTKISSYDASPASRDELPDAASRCVLRTISSWSFPSAAAGDEVRVNHDLEW
jgi:TonB family protein